MQYELYFSDLTEIAQQNILETAGISKPEDLNWDVFPITSFEVGDEDAEDEY